MTQKSIRHGQQPLFSGALRSLLLVAAIGAVACGSNDDSGAERSTEGNGIAAEWRGYCTATFTQDYVVHDIFDEAVFTAHVGDEFLVASKPTKWSAESRAALFYLTAHGPWEFEVTVPADQAFPFTMNCDLDTADHYQAVFADVDVYAAEDMATKLCQLRAGSVLPADNSGGFGYALMSSGKYEVYLGAFSTQCGATTGYIEPPQIEVFGVHTRLVPLERIYGPSK